MPSTRGHRGITVVIAFRGQSYLGRLENCLRSLVRQTLPPTEIIVSEQDETALAASICETVGASHLVTPARPMFNKSAALNVGIKHSKTEHVYLLDADVILAPTALEEAFKLVQAGKFVMLDSRRAHIDGPAGWDRALRKSWTVDWARTCFGLMNATTRKVWFSLKGYDERFVGWGSEDTFVTWKAEFRRIPTEWLAGVSVHQEHKSEKSYRAQADRNSQLLKALKGKPFFQSWGDESAAFVQQRTPKSEDAIPSPICVLITTFNRPDSLIDLLRDLRREAEEYPLDVRVFDDASSADYSAVKAFLGANGWHYWRAPKNHGKNGYWELTNKVFAAARSTTSKYFLQVPDDVRLCDRFFDRMLGLWRSIPDNQRAALNPLRDRLRADVGCWTGIDPVKGCKVDRVDWVDMCYLSERRFFEELGWRIQPIPPLADWIGSGVGSQISKRLKERGLSVYRTAKSHVVHVVAESKMNREVRLDESMRVEKFVDGPERARQLEVRGQVVAALASIPSREAALDQVVRSLLPQVDKVCVYLNGYDHVPGFLHQPNVEFARSQDHGDNGDAGKFWWCESFDGFMLTCDDDLIYPPDYVDKLVLYLESFHRKAVVGAHGALLKRPIKSYYASREVFHCLGDVPARQGVHVLGTGALAYHTSTIRVRRSDFEVPNMADVWFARLGQQQKTPFVVVPHGAGWLKHIDHEETIYAASRGDDSVQTEVVRGVPSWSVFR